MPFRHRFWAHTSGTEDLIFKVWVEPEDLDNGFDESFMRNFGGYINDCNAQKLAPSIFQLLLFLYDSDIVLTPPFWLPLSFLVGLHHVMAYWVGAGLLGYVPSGNTDYMRELKLTVVNVPDTKHHTPSIATEDK